MDREQAETILQAIGEGANIPGTLGIVAARPKGRESSEVFYLLTLKNEAMLIPIALLGQPGEFLESFEAVATPKPSPAIARILGADGLPAAKPSSSPALFLPEATAKARAAVVKPPTPPAPAPAKPKLFQPPPVDALGRKPWEVPIVYNTAAETARTELEFDEPEARRPRVEIEEEEGPEPEEEEVPPDERPDWEQEYPEVPPTLPDREDPYPAKAAQEAVGPVGPVVLNDYGKQATDASPLDYRRGPHGKSFGV